MNLTTPEWATNETIQTLKDLYETGKDIEAYNDKLKKFSGGPMIHEFLKNVKAQDTKRNKRKIYLYGGHDINLAHVQRTLGIKKYFGYPNYGSAIIFEKYRNSKNHKFVRVNKFSYF